MKTRLSLLLTVLALLGLTPAVGGPTLAGPAAQAAFADPAFSAVWERTDKLITTGGVTRAWMWGPGPNTAALQEPNAESPGGTRLVQYFDKSRMEINNPAGNKADPTYVTNGLLTVELVAGRMQTGASSYEERQPACIPVTGDANDTTAPTYASMQRVSNTTIADHPATSQMGQPVMMTINRQGDVGQLSTAPAIQRPVIAYYDDVTKHNIPDVFWTYLNATGPVLAGGAQQTARLSDPWFAASGRPISEAYWTTARINGQPQEVLVQLFERRTLTYNRNAPAQWQVEVGNIGQHYYDWRYKGAGACSAPVSGEITFQTFGEPAEQAVFASVIKGYGAAGGTVKVNQDQVPAQGDHINKLSAAFAAGNPPDVFLINYRRYGQFAAKGVLEPLGPYLDKSLLIRAADYYTPSLAAFTFNNTLTCIPQNISSLTVYYNKDLFQRYGVPLPTATWTWADFAAAAQALTKDTNGDGTTDIYGFGSDLQLIRLAPFIWSNGGALVDNEDKPTKLLLDTPEAREAFAYFVGLNKYSPTEGEIKAETGDTRFINGKLGMWLNSRAETPTFRTAIKTFTWDVAPMPMQKTAVTILHSDAYCMAAQISPERKAAAWDFIQYALGPRGQTVASKLGRIVPSLRSIANGPAFLDPTQPPANARVYLDVIPTIRRVPISAAWPAVESAVNAEIARAFYGTATLDQAIQAAVTKANAEFAKVNTP